MNRFVYVNGQYLPYHEAFVHVEDRGFQFADAVYEVFEVRDRCYVDYEAHITRFERSMRELQMPTPMSRAALGIVISETVRRNRITSGMVYLQVTRGTAPRDFYFPEEKDDVEPTLVCIARAMSAQAREKKAQRGIAVITTPDLRWARCDIKTVMLLPACLAKSEARKQGATEAWYVDSDGYVTEGGSSNAWLVTTNGKLVTRDADHAILAGITRETASRAIAALGLELEVRRFHVNEVYDAREAFVTAASSQVLPVVRVDGRQIGDGTPGSTTKKLRETFYSASKIKPL